MEFLHLNIIPITLHEDIMVLNPFVFGDLLDS